MPETASEAAALLRGGRSLQAGGLYIRPGGLCIQIRSDSPDFIEQLAAYFSHVVVDACDAEVVVEAYDTDALTLDIDWTDWPREPGKTGRKDAYHELADGRLLRKVRTGMVFLQSRDAVIAVGPCRALDNQVINFINSQYMNWLQRRGWLICHAAALDINGHGVGIAGLSGGGKSTLMLALMDRPDVSYVTNDRLFIKPDNGAVRGAGIPKMPRINPGTIVHNPALHGLIGAERRRELLALPREELWHLEEKHDAMIATLYGSERVLQETRLDTFLVLNWSHDTHDNTRLEEVDLASRQELLPAIMKSPGPFYQFADGSLYQASMQADPQTYLDALQGVRILEASGRVDTEKLKDELYAWITRAWAQ
jgi:HprK-related kinase B